ncbi:MAG: C10 family peptidase [Candidatus Krumholzibacteriota bacterium]|nr:C10 family peptidase [Candidatus Krumholzibacteriota bacterium]
MKKAFKILAVSVCVLSIHAKPATAGVVTSDEARIVAANYITNVINSSGSWGGEEYASVGKIEELKRGDRVLGYWCHIEPDGHVIVSLISQLAPVRASSETWDGDPACDAGIVDIIKYKIGQEHDYIEARLGPVADAPEDAIAGLCEYSCLGAWSLLLKPPEQELKEYLVDDALSDYQENGVLLTTNWRQGDPYNLYMPPDPSACGEDYGYRCAAGCTALGAAQIMKYWDWPPYGIPAPYDDYYDWTSMPDDLTTESPSAQINAVAILIAEIGLACNMDYCMDDGCGSGAFHEDMLSAYIANFHFDSGAFILPRVSLSSADWFINIQNNINMNMPLQYEVPGHSIVCDGWRVVSGLKQYHMNYGWANSVPDKSCWDAYAAAGSNTWFTLDLLPCTDLVSENVINLIRPAVALNQTLGGTYPPIPNFPWRYVNVDAQGENAVFQAGQLIQALSDKRILCTSEAGGAIRFYGSPSLHTRLFTRGDTAKGIIIKDGAVVLYGSGSIRLF